MSFNTRMIYAFPAFGWHVLMINSYARKLSNRPDNFTLQQRNDFLLKKARYLLWLFNIHLEVEGYDDLPKGPVLLTPNHKSNIDPILMLVALAKQTKDKSVMNKIPTFVAKKELSKKKVVRNALGLLNTFYVDRANPRQALEELSKFGSFVKENHTYGVIFPEGTRVKEDNLGEFKGGAFNIAAKNYLPIVPVAISDTREALNKNRKEKLVIKIKFLKAIKPTLALTSSTKAVGERVKKLIEGELANGKQE